MSLSTAHNINHSPSIYDGEVLEKVLLENDLAKLSPTEKVTHVKNVCLSLGLNPLTRPIQLIKFQGKEIMYATKDATEQLRYKHHVSITKIDTKMLTDGIYSVTAYAMLPNGRTDSSTGIVSVKGLQGEAMCNAMLKAETKAKRRATLSICGLGFIDETEVDSMKGAKKFDVFSNDSNAIEGEKITPQIEHIESIDIDKMVIDIGWCQSLKELEDKFKEYYRIVIPTRDTEMVKKLIDAKDKKKIELVEEKTQSQNINSETGEVSYE